MLKRIIIALVCILIPFTGHSAEQWTDTCPYCRFSIPSGAVVCGHCGRDLSLWRQQQRESQLKLLQWILEVGKEAQKAQQKKEAEEARQRAENEKREAALALEANKQINKDIVSFENRCEQIGSQVSNYFNSYNISDLDNLEYRLNSLESDFQRYRDNNYEYFCRLDKPTENRILQFNSDLNSVKYAINEAKHFVPNQLSLGNYKVTKGADGYYLDLPASFSASALTVPRSVVFNRNTVTILGISNNSLSSFINLKTITYEGELKKFDVEQHNSCPNLSAVYLSNSVPPSTQGSNVMCRNYTIYVPNGAVENYSKKYAWSNSVIAEKSGPYFAYKDLLYKSTNSGEAEVSKYLSSGTSVSIPDKVYGKKITGIGMNAFRKGIIKDILIPASVNHIGAYAFAGNTGLREIKLPISVRRIDDNAFSDCPGLTNVTVDGITPPTSFSNSFPKNSWITVGKAFNQYITTYPWNKNLFIRDTKETIHLAYDGTRTYRINELNHTATLVRGNNHEKIQLDKKVFDNNYTLDGIEDDAFKGCTELKEITIPETVVSIGADAFSGCTNLASVFMSNDMAPTCSRPIFDKNNKTNVYVPKSAVRLYKKQKGWKSSNKIVGLESAPQNSFSNTGYATSGYRPVVPQKSSFDGFATHFAGLRAGWGKEKTEEVSLTSLGAYFDYVPGRWGVHFGVDFCVDFDSEELYGFGFFAGPEIRLTQPSSSPVDIKIYAAPGYVANSFGFDVGVNLGWRSSTKLSLYDVTFGYQNWGPNASVGYLGVGTGITVGTLIISLGIIGGIVLL